MASSHQQEGAHMNTYKKVHCGIDVSKKKLDARIRGKDRQYSNTLTGIKQLLAEAGDMHYVLESTGGYERLAAWTLLAEGMTVSIVNPGRVREYAKSVGQLAKTDKVDARIITDYAAIAELKRVQLPSASQRKLTALVDRRQQLTQMRVMETNRLDTTPDLGSRDMIGEHVKYLDAQLQGVEEAIRHLIDHDEEIKKKTDTMIKEIKGIGWITATSILAYIPEIGTLSRREVAAISGLAPFNRDSGNYKGRRHIYGGREKIRTALYMPAMSAARYNPVIKEFRERLINKNHCLPKVARIAVMRKLLIAANAVMKNSEKSLAS